MTDRLYAKYIWLIFTIHDAGKISFKDIACKWDDAYINDLHHPLKTSRISRYGIGIGSQNS